MRRRCRNRRSSGPNGFLHLGHAGSIVLNYEPAKEFGGRCLGEPSSGLFRFDDENRIHGVTSYEGRSLAAHILVCPLPEGFYCPACAKQPGCSHAMKRLPASYSQPPANPARRSPVTIGRHRRMMLQRRPVL
ncbi:glutamate--tRNA ligase family protein [Mesorhizobium hawassense]|uniref:glutamate--tRNA ligase family protein n=1 Tax=Mesorhizobium hawassense TaxID=1209954 RepID=UPI003CCB3987